MGGMSSGAEMLTLPDKLSLSKTGRRGQLGKSVLPCRRLRPRLAVCPASEDVLHSKKRVNDCQGTPLTPMSPPPPQDACPVRLTALGKTALQKTPLTRCPRFSRGLMTHILHPARCNARQARQDVR